MSISVATSHAVILAKAGIQLVRTARCAHFNRFVPATFWIPACGENDGMMGSAS